MFGNIQQQSDNQTNHRRKACDRYRCAAPAVRHTACIKFPRRSVRNRRRHRPDTCSNGLQLLESTHVLMYMYNTYAIKTMITPSSICQCLAHKTQNPTPDKSAIPCYIRPPQQPCSTCTATLAEHVSHRGQHIQDACLRSRLPAITKQSCPQTIAPTYATCVNTPQSVCAKSTASAAHHRIRVHRRDSARCQAWGLDGTYGTGAEGWQRAAGHAAGTRTNSRRSPVVDHTWTAHRSRPAAVVAAAQAAKAISRHCCCAAAAAGTLAG